jgi:prepilin-type N-terminal cleavage/methylation domain-containing protein
MNKKKGFTLIELLIVVAIIGIVAAIAIPNLLTALQKGRQKATMGDLKSIGTAISSYLTDLNMTPDVDTATLPNYMAPFHIQKMPNNDGWGQAYDYQGGEGPDSLKTQEYSIRSAGKDRLFQTTWAQAPTEYVVSRMAQFEYDIIYSNGIYSYGPKTK